MAFRSQAKQNQVKTRKFAWSQAEESSQGLVVGRSGGACVFLLGMNAEDVFRRRRYLRQHGLICHAVIALRVVWRHMAFVTPKEADLVPGDGSARAPRE